MPSASASAASTAHLVADRRRAGSASPTAARRVAVRRRPGRALAAAEHVGRDDEPAVGVDRPPGPIIAVPPARGGVPGTGGPGDVAVAGERVQHEHGVRRRRGERAPRLVGDAHVGQLAAGSRASAAPSVDEPTAAGRVPLPPRAGGGREDLDGRVAVDALVTSSRSTCLGRAEAGVEVGHDVVDALDADRQPHEARGDAGGQPAPRRRAGCAWCDAGWMTRLRTSPMLARWLCSSARRRTACPASTPPRRSNDDDRARAAGQVLLPRARATGSTAGPRSRPSRPRRAPRATPRPPARSARGAPCAATASRCPG